MKILTAVVVLMLTAVWGMTGTSAAPAVSESPSLPTIPVLTPISILDLTAVTRPPSSGFEYALEQSRWEVSDWEIVRSIIRCESTFDRFAVGDEGEIGWMQVHPVHTAPGCEGDLREASANLRCGLRELRAAIDACGSVESALRRYNAGQCDSMAGAGYARRVLRLVERGKGVVVASK